MDEAQKCSHMLAVEVSRASTGGINSTKGLGPSPPDTPVIKFLYQLLYLNWVFCSFFLLKAPEMINMEVKFLCMNYTFYIHFRSWKAYQLLSTRTYWYWILNLLTSEFTELLNLLNTEFTEFSYSLLLPCEIGTIIILFLQTRKLKQKSFRNLLNIISSKWQSWDSNLACWNLNPSTLPSWCRLLSIAS